MLTYVFEGVDRVPINPVAWTFRKMLGIKKTTEKQNTKKRPQIWNMTLQGAQMRAPGHRFLDLKGATEGPGDHPRPPLETDPKKQKINVFTLILQYKSQFLFYDFFHVIFSHAFTKTLPNYFHDLGTPFL